MQNVRYQPTSHQPQECKIRIIVCLLLASVNFKEKVFHKNIGMKF